MKSDSRMGRCFLKGLAGDTRTLANRFRDRAGEHTYFLFLDAPGVEPTNNRTEQAIRHVVMDRRVTQGTRSHAGIRFCEGAWMVVATCACQGKSVYHFFLHAIKAALNPSLPYPVLVSVNP